VTGSTEPDDARAAGSGANGGSVDAKDIEALPGPIRSVIERRASAWTRPLAEAFAGEALRLEGVELRGQQSQGEPWYFQVRRRESPSVIAYVHPRHEEVHVEYRLPMSSPTHGVAVPATEPYGLVAKVRQWSDLPDALSVLRDALALAGGTAPEPGVTLDERA
jgi:hypothetical protein